MKNNFRHSHSTAHALIEITEKIKQPFDSGQYSCRVFLDLQKAFNTVNHDILLRKLDYYLQDSVFTSVNGYQSNMRQLKYDVPQGSALGPLLFILFINDLHLAVQYSSVHQFADDANLVEKSLKQFQKVNKDHKPTAEWVRANRLSLNANKTEDIPSGKKFWREENLANLAEFSLANYPI